MVNIKHNRLSLHGHRRFHPPSQHDTPRDLFTEGGRSYSDARFRRIGDGSELLIFVAACSLHATTPSQAVGFGIKASNEDIASGYLEQQPQSRNRAELHAALQVVREIQTWGLVEFNRLVLACSSQYLVKVCPCHSHFIHLRSYPMLQYIISGQKSYINYSVSNLGSLLRNLLTSRYADFEFH